MTVSHIWQSLGEVQRILDPLRVSNMSGRGLARQSCWMFLVKVVMLYHCWFFSYELPFGQNPASGFNRTIT